MIYYAEFYVRCSIAGTNQNHTSARFSHAKAKATIEAEQAQIAKRRADDEAAAALELEKAAAALEKQSKIKPIVAPSVPEAAPAKGEASKSIFASFMPKPAAKKAKKVIAKKVR